MYAEVAGSLQKPKSQVPVGPVMLGFFLFVVVGSGEVCESTQRFCIDPICTARTCCSAARQFPPSSPAARCVHGHIQDASSKVQQLTQHPVCVCLLHSSLADHPHRHHWPAPCLSDGAIERLWRRQHQPARRGHSHTSAGEAQPLRRQGACGSWGTGQQPCRRSSNAAATPCQRALQSTPRCMATAS
jgi:hypothetical protein